MTRASLSSLELFSGAGGLALGVAAAGFQHRLLLEYNRDACKTLRVNRSMFGPDCVIHEGDVHDFDFSPYAGVDLLAAGAPCQPFSIGGKHRGHRDERNLFPQVFRAIREVRPRAVIVENVKGLLRESLREFVEFIELQLANPDLSPSDPLDPEGWRAHLPTLRRARRRPAEHGLRYRVKKMLANAADFGAPQRRERVFFVAMREDLPHWISPRESHSEAALRIAQEITGSYWKEHGLHRATLSTHPNLGKWQRLAGGRERWRTVRDALHGLPDPGSPDWPNHVAQSGARAYPGHTGSPLDMPAKTLKAGVHGVPGGENMLRRSNGKVRYFTVREAARLQTFPDNYVFTGAWGEAMRQIGNAVPCVLAQAVARSVREALEDRDARATRLPDTHSEFEQVELTELIGSV